MKIDPLLEHYPVRIREVTIGVILGISFMFYIFPRFLGESEKMDYNIIEEIESFDIPQTEQIKIPEPPARPSVPVASEDQFFDDDITIEDTDFDDFDDWGAPPPQDAPKFRFIPFDKPPKPRVPIKPIYPDIAQEAGSVTNEDIPTDSAPNAVLSSQPQFADSTSSAGSANDDSQFIGNKYFDQCLLHLSNFAPSFVAKQYIEIFKK